MSELSKEKTRRKYIDFLENYHWEEQISLFITNQSQIDTFLIDMEEIRSKLRSHNRNTAFLYRIALKNKPAHQANWYEGEKKYVTEPYMTLYSSARDLDIYKVLGKSDTEFEYNPASRDVKSDKLATTINSISKQQPHNLKKFFNGKTVRRYEVINKKKLIKVEAKTN